MNLRAVFSTLSRRAPLSGALSRRAPLSGALSWRAPLSGALVALSALSTIGCNGPPATFVGTIQGKTFAPIEVISDLTTVNLGRTAVIVASTEQGSCALFSQNKIRKDSQFLIISLADVDFDLKQLNPPSAATLFPVLDPISKVISTDTVSLVSFQKSDASCMDPMPVDGVSGSVQVTYVGELEFEGSGDVTMSTGDHITFTFSSTPCFSLGSTLSAQMMPTCQ